MDNRGRVSCTLRRSSPHYIRMTRGDDKTIAITPTRHDGNNVSPIKITDSDTGTFRIYDEKNTTVITKTLTAQTTDGRGNLLVLLTAADTQSFGIDNPALRPGQVIRLFWELQLVIGGKTETPIINAPFDLVIDSIL